MKVYSVLNSCSYCGKETAAPVEKCGHCYCADCWHPNFHAPEHCTEGNRVFHISLTGVGCGLTACGRTLGYVHEQGDKSAHVPYSGNIEQWVQSTVTCADCRNEWDAAKD